MQMETNLPTSEKTKSLIMKQLFEPLLQLLNESNCTLNCKALSEQLDSFQYIGFEDMKNNSIQVCFDNLKQMYFTNEIPLRRICHPAVNEFLVFA
jgi:hypothetical protein